MIAATRKHAADPDAASVRTWFHLVQQAQHLHILASPHLQHARLHQATQGLELFGQVPLRQGGGGLVQGIDLALDQRKVVDRIEDHILPVVAAWMPGNHLPAAADHDLIDIAAHPDILMAVCNRDRVIIGVVPHERLRIDLTAHLITCLERRRLQRPHRGQIALQSRTDRLLVAAKDVALPPATLGFQVGIEGVPARKERDRHHVVPAGVTNHPLNIAFVVPLAGAPIAVPKQVMGLKAAEQRRADARAVRLDLRDQAAVIVIQYRLRNTAEEGEGMDMAVHPSFRRRRWIGPHEIGIAVRQVHNKEVGLLLNTADNDDGFTEIRLRMSRRMRQWHKHLLASPLSLSHVILDDRIAAGEPVLGPKPLE